MRNAPLILVLVLALVLGGVAFLFLFATPTMTPVGGGLGPAVVSAEELDETPVGELEGAGTDAAKADRTEVSGAGPAMSLTPETELGAAGDADKPMITGRVVDVNGAPLAGALVVAAGPDPMPLDYKSDSNTGFGRRWHATSRSDGTFALRGPEPGGLRLGAWLAGYAPTQRDNLTLPAGGGGDFGDLALESSVLLEGRVVVAGAGPVEGARLYVEAATDSPFTFFSSNMPRIEAAVTDSAGRFRVDMLAAGPWKIRVASDEQPERTFEGRTERPGERRTGLEFELDPGQPIAGRVTGHPAGGLENLVVRATPSGQSRSFRPASAYREVPVAADGSFHIGGCAVDQEYELRAREKDPGAPFWGGESRTRTKSVKARAGQSGILLEWTGTTGLAFQVLDRTTGQPVEAFSVRYGTGWMRSYQVEGETVEEHPEGRVRLDELNAGRRGNANAFKIEIEAAGYSTFEQTVELREGEVLNTGPFQLSEAPVVLVTVLDARTGEPVQDAEVHLTEADSSGQAGARSVRILGDNTINDFGQGPRSRMGRSDASGIARLTSFEGQSGSLRVVHDDHTEWTLENLTMPAGKAVELEARLGIGGRVEVRVVDAFGAAVPGAKVSERTPPEPSDEAGSGFEMRRSVIVGGNTGPSDSKVSDQDGRVVFEHLPPGVHQFKLDESSMGGNGFLVIFDDGSDDSDDWTDLDVQEGGEHELELRQTPKSSLVGRVTEAGEALAGATVSLTEKGDDDAMGMRGFSFPGMSGGDQSTTDGRGGFRIEDVEPGSYLLSVQHASRIMAAEYELELVVGENTQDLDLPVAIIEGRVTDLEGAPVAGVTVEVQRVEGSGMRYLQAFSFSDGEASVSIGGDEADPATTGSDGRYQLRGVEVGVELVVSAEMDKSTPAQTDPLELSEGQVLSGVDLVLAPAGAVTVTVAGVPEDQWAMVMANYLGESETPVAPVMEFADDGQATLSGLRPGPWSIEIQLMGPQGSGDPPESQTLEVVAGQSLPVHFQL